MKIVRFALIGLIPLLFSGCIFTKYEVVEVPKYIVRPMPQLKIYDIKSSYTFKGLVKEDGYIKVPQKQFTDYVDLKMKLESELEKANDQVKIYNKLADTVIIQETND